MTREDNDRIDLAMITNLVTPNAKVLDIGCNDGTLLKMLENPKVR